MFYLPSATARDVVLFVARHHFELGFCRKVNHACNHFLQFWYILDPVMTRFQIGLEDVSNVTTKLSVFRKL